MAYSVPFIVILIVLRLSCCIPVDKEDNKNPVTITLKTSGVEEDTSEVYEDTTTTASCLSPQEQETTTRSDISSYSQDSVLLVVPRDSFSNDEVRGSRPVFQYFQPSTPLSPDWARSPYQVNSADSLEAMGIGMSNFQGILYPHAHPKLFAAINPGFSVNSLPPVHSTYIHGLHYPGENVQRADYEIDVLNPENTVFLPTLVRSGRMLRSPEDDFLAELSHDAIMNNILPTMAVPFVRYAGSSVPISNRPYDGRDRAAVAMYPNVASGGCAQSILFSCSPKIIRGSLKQKPYSDSSQLSSLGAPIAYREQSEANRI